MNDSGAADPDTVHRNKVVVISVTKIESDILESFVRHSLTFADEMIIADNGSADGAGEILEKLCGEGLPLAVKKIRKVEFDHAEMMNALMEEAFAEHGADLVFPLDIDEFLLCEGGSDACRDIVHGLDTGQVYRLGWRKYAPRTPYVPSMGFLLAHECYRETELREDSKIAVGRGLRRQGTIKMVSGCHHSYLETPSGPRWIGETELPGLHVAHFHWRSNERYRAKLMIGRLGTVAKYSVHTASVGYDDEYQRRVIMGEEYTLGDVFDKEGERFCPIHCCRMQEVRYASDAILDPVGILMHDGVHIAEAYAEMRVLEKRRSVDIIIPFWGDAEACRASLDCACGQDYPYKRVYVCNMEGFMSHVAEALLEEYREEPVVLLEAAEGSTVFRRLSSEASGDYVQWLMPQGNLPSGHLREIVTCMESQDFDFSMMAAAGEPGDDEELPYLDLCEGASFRGYRCQAMWRHMLVLGKYPANGMDGVLMRHRVMEAVRWFQDCVMPEHIFAMNMWSLMLQQTLEHEQGMIMGAFPSGGIRPRSYSADEYVAHQINWFYLLSAHQDALTEEELRAALRNMMDRSRIVARRAREADPWLIGEYGRIMSGICGMAW